MKNESLVYQVKKENEKKIPFDEILQYLDIDICNILRKLSSKNKEQIEEIRIRVDKPLMINIRGFDYFVCKDGKLSESYLDSYITDKIVILKTFKLICNYSIYAYEDELKNGFITIKGGHRIGIAGKGLYSKSGLETIKDISSLNIRISREQIGNSKKILPYIIRNNNTIYNTLIVSPPQCGKTTLLRDLIRNISNGIPKLSFKGLKVGVVDERSEIAGVYKGKPQNDVGLRTDILDSLRKHEGIFLLIRSMSPHVIATDELGGKNDAKAIHEALKAGVKLISTAHGENISDIMTKPYLRNIISEKIFERYILLDNSDGPGTIKDIIDENFKSIM